MEKGSGMVEFLLVAGPLLLTALGGVEISHWMFIRQAVNLALMEAGRIGTTSHAQPALIATAFEQALEALYPPTPTKTSAQRLREASNRAQAKTGEPAWHIQLLTPHHTAFIDFATANPALQHMSGLPTIDNSYQLENHQSYLARGWPDGVGPTSGQTIFEANTLSLRLTWRYQPLLPGVGKIAGNSLVLKEEATLAMQSHPVLWPDNSAGRVTREAFDSTQINSPAYKATPNTGTATTQNGKSGTFEGRPSQGESGDNGMEQVGHSTPDDVGGNENTPAPWKEKSEIGYQGDTDAGLSEDNICT